MLVGEYCTREVIVAERSTDVREVARLMRNFHVGTVVVVERDVEGNRPVGIVTDRDLVLEILAPEVDPGALRVADLCVVEVAVAKAEDDLMATLDRMRALGVRRMPVVGDDGVLQGLLAVDDLLPVVGEIMSNLSQLVVREVNKEARTRS